MAVSSIGIGSGIDLESLVVGLLESEKTPLFAALDSKTKSIKADISAYGTLNSVLDKFKASLEALDSADKTQKRSATSSDDSYFSASASATASSGSYSIEVINLAKAQKLATTASFSANTDPVGEGTLTISNAAGDSFVVDVGLDENSSQRTLSDLRDLINNNEDNFGVQASILEVDADGDPATSGTVQRLVFSSQDTGLDNALTISVSDAEGGDTDASGLSRFYFDSSDPGSQLEELQPAENAELSVDGLSAFSNSNTFENVIDGVTITAKRALDDPNSPEGASVSVATDTDSIVTAVKNIVDAYNAIQSTIDKNTNTTESTDVSAAFNGDFTVRSLQGRLRSLLGDSFSGNTELQSLASIGITTQRNGQLKLDETALKSAIENTPEEFNNVFAGADGLASRFESRIEPFIESGGILDSRTDGFNSQLKRLDDQRERLDYRFEVRERVLRDQFIALDGLVASLQNTGAFLVGQLANISAINRA